MIRFFRNAYGFSLVQGMVLAGVLAGTSLVATKLISDQKKIQKSSETRDKVEDLHMALSAILGNRNHCRQTMVSNGLSTALSTSGVTTSTHNLTSIRTSDGAIVVDTTNYYLNNSVKVESIFLTGQVSTGKRNLVITYRRMGGANATDRERLKGGAGAQTISKTMSLRIQRNPTVAGTPNPGVFESCYNTLDAGTTDSGVASQELGNDIAQTMCNELVPIDLTQGETAATQKAFEWDATNSICRPKAKCPTGQIYSGINSNGTVKCRNIEDWVDFNQFLSKEQIVCPVGHYIGIEYVAGNAAWSEASQVARFRCYPP